MSNLITDLIGEEIVPRQTAVSPDGWRYDVDTGEVVSYAGAPDQFIVDSDDAAEWVLERRSEFEADVAKEKMRLAALTANQEALLAEKARRLAWWDWRFRAPLVAYACRKLGDGKARTARFAWGAVAFRAGRVAHEITDMAAAVAWVRDRDATAVRVVETVALKDVLALRALRPDEPRPDWLVERPPVESVVVKT